MPVEASVPTVPPFMVADADPVPAVNAKAARSSTLLDTLCNVMLRLDGAASGAAPSKLVLPFTK
jgi:hypothetical protein